MCVRGGLRPRISRCRVQTFTNKCKTVRPCLFFSITLFIAIIKVFNFFNFSLYICAAPPPHYPMKTTPSSTTTAVGGAGDTTTRPTPSAWTSPFENPQSYTSRPPSLHPTLRPWREFLSLRSFSLPYGYSDSLLRLRKNISHFRINYALIALLALFLSLFFHPYSLLLFVFLFLAWYALYFSRDSPIILFGRVFDDRVVAGVLGVITIVGLVLTGVGLNVLVALVVAVVVVGVHGVFRNSEDLYVDEESIGEGGLVSVVSSQPLRSYARIG